MSRYITRSKKQRSQGGGGSGAEQIQAVNSAARRGLRRLNILPTSTGTPQLLSSDSCDNSSDMSLTVTTEQEEQSWRNTTSTPSPPSNTGQLEGIGTVGTSVFCPPPPAQPHSDYGRNNLSGRKTHKYKKNVAEKSLMPFDYICG